MNPIDLYFKIDEERKHLASQLIEISKGGVLEERMAQSLAQAYIDRILRLIKE